MTLWLNPKNWPLGLSLLLWRVVNYFPASACRVLAHWLGLLMRNFNKSRLKVVRRNLELVAPEKSLEERETIVDGVYDSMGMMPFETALAWFSSKKTLSKKVTFHGLEKLQAELDQGRGVLLLSPHFTHLDLTAAMIAYQVPMDGFYKPHKTPAFDQFVINRRERFLHKLLNSDDMRGAVRTLKQGRVLWYAPDHDYRNKMSVFAPFFGIQTSTISAPDRLIKLTKCAVFVLGGKRIDNHYEVTLDGPIAGLPAETPELSAAVINQALEKAITQAMDQYMWIHQRFRTRPEGEASFYKK